MEKLPSENPKPLESTPEAPAVEMERKEAVVLTLSEIKDLIRSQLGNKAKINKLELIEKTEGLELNAELDAGMLGGKIIISGLIVNTGSEIAVQNTHVDARGYVKSRIEENLSKFGRAIKTYFEKHYRKQVSSIQIDNSSLHIEFKETPKSSPDPQQEKTQESKTETIVDEQKSKTELDRIIEDLKLEKSPFHRSYFMGQYGREFIKNGRFNDARKLVMEIMKDGESKDSVLASIDRQEKESKKL